MTNTMKTITFIVSLFVFLFFFIIVNTITPTEILLESPNAAYIAAALYMSAYLVVLYSQALIRYLYVKSRIKTLNIMKTYPAALKFELRERLLIMILPLLAVILPMVSRREINADSMRSLLFLVVLSLIIEVLYRMNSRTFKIRIGDKGIAITGVDFRLELPIPLSYSNAAGFYPYERIENYLALSNQVIIYHTYDFGTITINCSEEDARQIKGLLVSKKIPERRY